MDTNEANAVLAEWFEPWRAQPYAALVARIGGDPLTAQVARGTRIYQLELECYWDGSPGGDVRVLGSIDDGGLRAFVPVTLDFIRSHDERFVGE